jgi:hypothetical protein
MEEKQKKRMGLVRRAMLIAVGYLALMFDKLEGKSTEPPKLTRRGRIKIVK